MTLDVAKIRRPLILSLSKDPSSRKAEPVEAYAEARA
jgi:hypothetical protein